MTENLIQNGDFEADWGDEKSHRCRVFPVDGEPYETDVGNIFTPPGWITWYVHDPGPPGEPGQWDQPEVRDAWKHMDPHRVYDGEKATLLFTFWRRHHAGFYQQVQVAPGANLSFSAYAHAWSNTNIPGHSDCTDKPRCSAGVGTQAVAIPIADAPPLSGDPWQDALQNFAFRIGIDPTGGTNPLADTVQWGETYHIYNEFYRLTAEAVAEADTVTVFLCSITEWQFKHNDAYWDSVRLELTDEPPPPPPPYQSTMLVLPQDATPAQLDEIFTLAYPKRRTFGFSHDDAGNLNGTSVLYNIPDDEIDAYLNFYATRYPNVKVQFAYTSDWPKPSSELLLWQCHEEWKDEKLATPTCSKTLCQIGCWIADCAMAQRYYGIEPYATPSTVNQALGDVGGFSGCETTWAGMKAALGLEVVKRSYDPVEVQEWLDTGNIVFGEVEPETYMHFVMITKYQEGRFWMFDPQKNVQAWVDEYYPGIESWRLIRPYDNPPPPPAGNPIGLHLQSMSLGWDAYIRDAKPNVTKVLASMHDVLGVKQIRPDALVVWRHVDNDYNGILDNPDPHEGARRWIAKFRDGLFYECDKLAQVPGITKPYFYVESINEVYPSLNEAAIVQAVNFDLAFLEELDVLGLPLRGVVFTAGIGNPHQSEYELLVPLARKAEQYGALMGYHGYFWVDHGASHLESDWEWHAGRWAEMDKIFVQHGMHVKWFGAEGGAHFDCNSGWKAANCLNGDWEAYKALLLQWKAKVDEWNVLHGNRYLGQVLFTTGGHGWASFEIQESEMKSLTNSL